MENTIDSFEENTIDSFEENTIGSSYSISKLFYI
jgi:hypothetical protein